jgi:hypothetical protein
MVNFSRVGGQAQSLTGLSQSIKDDPYVAKVDNIRRSCPDQHTVSSSSKTVNNKYSCTRYPPPMSQLKPTILPSQNRPTPVASVKIAPAY